MGFGGDDTLPPRLPTPAPAPDLTDEMVQRARLAARRRALMGSSLTDSFLTGPLGDLSAPPLGVPKAGGY